MSSNRQSQSPATAASHARTPYIGSTISLVSKANIRYVGVLYTVDTVQSTIALAKVKSFGTEDRPSENPVAVRDDTFEYIIFKASDIKDLVVCETPQPAPSLLRMYGLSDPAIIDAQPQSSPRHMGPTPQAEVTKSAAPAAPPGPTPTVPSSGQHSQRGGRPGGSGRQQRGGANRQSDSDRRTAGAAGEQQNHQQQSQDVRRRQGGFSSFSERSSFGSRPAGFDKTTASSVRPAGGEGAHSRGARQRQQTSANSSEQQEQQRRAPMFRPPPPHLFQPPWGGRPGLPAGFPPRPSPFGARGGLQFGSGRLQFGDGGPRPMFGPLARPPNFFRGSFVNFRFTGGRGEFRRVGRVLKFDSEYDFEKALEEFQEKEKNDSGLVVKGDVEGEVAEGGEGDDEKEEEKKQPRKRQTDSEVDEEEVEEGEVVDKEKEEEQEQEEEKEGKKDFFYDPKVSFFDNISSEAKERGERGANRRVDWRREREMNTETFGLAAIRRQQQLRWFFLQQQQQRRGGGGGGLPFRFAPPGFLTGGPRAFRGRGFAARRPSAGPVCPTVTA